MGQRPRPPDHRRPELISAGTCSAVSGRSRLVAARASPDVNVCASAKSTADVFTPVADTEPPAYVAVIVYVPACHCWSRYVEAVPYADTTTVRGALLAPAPLTL